MQWNTQAASPEWKKKFLFFPKRIKDTMYWLETVEWRTRNHFRYAKEYRTRYDKNLEIAKQLQKLNEDLKPNETSSGFATISSSGANMAFSADTEGDIVFSNLPRGGGELHISKWYEEYRFVRELVDYELGRK